MPDARLAANAPHAAAAVDSWDRHTDGRTLDRFIDPAPRTMRAVITVPGKIVEINVLSVFDEKMWLT